MRSASDSIVSSGSHLWKNYNLGESFIFLNSSLLISYVLRLASENHFSTDQNQNENQVTGTEKLFIMENVDCKVKLFDKKLTEIFSKVTWTIHTAGIPDAVLYSEKVCNLMYQ